MKVENHLIYFTCDAQPQLAASKPSSSAIFCRWNWGLINSACDQRCHFNTFLLVWLQPELLVSSSRISAHLISATRTYESITLPTTSLFTHTFKSKESSHARHILTVFLHLKNTVRGFCHSMLNLQTVSIPSKPLCLPSLHVAFVTSAPKSSSAVKCPSPGGPVGAGPPLQLNNNGTNWLWYPLVSLQTNHLVSPEGLLNVIATGVFVFPLARRLRHPTAVSCSQTFFFGGGGEGDVLI